MTKTCLDCGTLLKEKQKMRCAECRQKANAKAAREWCHKHRDRILRERKEKKPTTRGNTAYCSFCTEPVLKLKEYKLRNGKYIHPKCKAAKAKIERAGGVKNRYRKWEEK